jgi:hypothetical protein
MVHSCSNKTGTVCSNQQKNRCTDKKEKSVNIIRKAGIGFDEGNENKN